MSKKEEGTLHVLVARTARVVLKRLMPVPGTFAVQQSGARGSKVVTLSRMLGVRKGQRFSQLVDLDTGVIVLKPER